MLTIVNVAISLFAVISSILTTFIHNKHQEKLKFIEFKMNKYQNNIIHYREIYENYLRYAGLCVLSHHNAPYDKYSEYHYLALMCSPEHICVDITYINDLIKNQKWDKAKQLLDELVPKITEVVKSL